VSQDLQVIRYDPETKVWEEDDGLGTGTGAGDGAGSGLDGLLGEGFGGFGLLGFTLGVGGFNASGGNSPKFPLRANNSN
jgi:hypothetical protein